MQQAIQPHPTEAGWHIVATVHETYNGPIRVVEQWLQSNKFRWTLLGPDYRTILGKGEGEGRYAALGNLDADRFERHPEAVAAAERSREATRSRRLWTRVPEN